MPTALSGSSGMCIAGSRRPFRKRSMADLTQSQLDTLRRLSMTARPSCSRRCVPANEEAAERPAALGPEVGDAIDSGDDRFQAGMAHVDKQRDQEELMAIEAARGRMSDGSYGECVDCGKAIPVERLKAQPTALRCVPARRRTRSAPVGADVSV
jgi:RNA polymerase-binding transcription factor DksA